MAHIDLLVQSEQLPAGAMVRYEEIEDNVYALHVFSQAQLILLPGDGNGDVEPPQALLTDDITGALATIPVLHHETHEGEKFTVSYKTPDASPLADDETIIFIVRTGGSRYSHIDWRPNCGGDAEIEIYEGTAISGGTPMTVRNKKRTVGDNANTATVIRDPATVDNVGASLDNEFIPGGTGGNSQGGRGEARDEFILQQNTNYMFRLTNRAGNNQPASLRLEWYEEADN